jgi:hypothetical protein
MESSPVKREIVGDAQANSFLARENRKRNIASQETKRTAGQ